MEKEEFEAGAFFHEGLSDVVWKHLVEGEGLSSPWDELLKDLTRLETYARWWSNDEIFMVINQDEDDGAFGAVRVATTYDTPEETETYLADLTVALQDYSDELLGLPRGEDGFCEVYG